MSHLFTKTLSEIVAEQHRSAAVFEQFHLNYCCKGKQSLHEACKENNVPVNDVIHALEGLNMPAPAPLNFDTIPLSHLADYIVHTHHSFVKKQLPYLDSLLQKLIVSHGKKYSQLEKIAVLFAELSAIITHQVNLEETLLFILVKQMENNGFDYGSFDEHDQEDFEQTVMHLQTGHTQVKRLMGQVKTTAGNFIAPANSCIKFKLLYASLNAFEEDLQQHLHLENDILFPGALQLQKQLRIEFFCRY